MAKTKEIPGTEIKQTNRLYVAIREIGHCNDKGRSVMSVGLKGKTIAEPNKPLSTVGIALLDMVMELARYTDDEAAKEDIALLKEWVDGIELTTPGEQE